MVNIREEDYMRINIEKIIEGSQEKPLPVPPSRILQKKPVIIYGAGSGGAILCNMLLADNINVKCFLDKNAKENEWICGIPKYKPEQSILSQNEKKDIIVIIAVWDWLEHKSIVSFLRENGYQNLIMFNEVFYYYLSAGNTITGNVGYEYYSENKKNILRVEQLFEDTLSHEIYIRNIKSYIEHDFRNFYPKVEGIQYFPNDIHFSKGHDRFVDCGAYIGDTIEQLYKLKGKVDSIVAFEPDNINFKILSRIVEETCYADKVTLFPCGIWSETKPVRFSNVSNSPVSTISDNGESLTQCVRIDDALYGFEPTFIKMDIEGAEFEALKGAKRTIMDNKPDLAICVYHAANHIWDIPLFINSINPNYKFYLRTHGHFGIETVLYATIPK